MASKIPTSWSQLKSIFGMGEHKLKRYGPRFLKVIIAYAQEIGMDLNDHAGTKRQRKKTEETR